MSPSAGRVAQLSVVLLAGCQSVVTLVLPSPDLPSHPRSELIVVEPANGRGPGYMVYAMLPTGQPALAIPNDARIAVLIYADALESLELPMGAIPLPQQGDEARLLPGGWMYAAATNIDGPNAGVWQPIEMDALARIKIKAFDFLACIKMGGCVNSDAQNDRCTLPCPTPDEPLPPALPAPVCPDGWAHEPTDANGLNLCHPDILDVAVCSGAMMQRYGQKVCSPIGPCPSGQYADEVETFLGPILYVNQTQTRVGSGTFVDPYRDLALAAAHATAGSMIAVAEGAYSYAVLTATTVAIVGKCARDTTVGEIIARASGARVSGVRVKSNTAGVYGFHDVEVTESLIESPSGLSVKKGGAIKTSSVALRGAFGDGIYGPCGSYLDIRNTTIEGYTSGLVCGDSTCHAFGELMAKDVVIFGSTVAAGQYGVISSSCATDIERLLIHDRQHVGFKVANSHSVSLKDTSVVRISELPNLGSESFGLLVDCANTKLERIFIEDARNCAASFGDGSNDITEIVTRRTLLGDGGIGSGLCLQPNAEANVHGFVSDDDIALPIFLNISAIGLRLSDFIARSSSSTVTDNVTVLVSNGPFFELDRGFIADAKAGIDVGNGSSICLKDLTVRGGGVAVFAHALATSIDIDRLEIEGALGGVQFSSTPANMRDVRIAHTIGDRSKALSFTVTGSLTLSRFRINDNEGAAIVLEGTYLDSRSRAQLEDGEVSGNATGIISNVDPGLIRWPSLLLRVRYHDNAVLVETP